MNEFGPPDFSFEPTCSLIKTRKIDNNINPKLVLQSLSENNDYSQCGLGKIPVLNLGAE